MVGFLVIASVLLARFSERGIAPTARATEFSGHIFAALPVVVVSFTMHYNSPRYYEELREHTPARYAAVAGGAFAAVALVYSVVATAGYLTFGSATLGDVLSNFESA